uniref:Glutamine amidotransferase domain-containing protein n=1 Tax=Entomoneis paludosa TaxID=265537 RepID=A0A7S2YMM2_9STRA|mmetsp:Transcript_38995/g.80972  ORF Transcript_38995/g.80972 Transcript_38995/m.80972 type:complete len:340 (+) Transcript_38995:2-1021(+)
MIEDEASSSIIRRVVGDRMADEANVMDFAFFGCEESFGYGPIRHTAGMFLDLIGQAAESDSADALWSISIHIFNAKLREYPSDEEWKKFTGVILPGSYSSACEQNVPWIDKLKQVIQQVIVPQQIPTLGICFGHQIMAQSFEPQGKVEKLMEQQAKIDKAENENDTQLQSATLSVSSISCCPSPRAGRVSLASSQTGKDLLGKASLDLFVTHGDHVAKLPPTALSLGGDEIVPIQAAAYYGTPEQAEEAQQLSSLRKPYAMTFQSHLEYATSRDLGLHRTLEMIMDQMEHKGDIADDYKIAVREDARERFPQVQADSIEAMVMVGRTLGWFPSRSDFRG